MRCVCVCVCVVTMVMGFSFNSVLCTKWWEWGGVHFLLLHVLISCFLPGRKCGKRGTLFTEHLDLWVCVCVVCAMCVCVRVYVCVFSYTNILCTQPNIMFQDVRSLKSEKWKSVSSVGHSKPQTCNNWTHSMRVAFQEDYWFSMSRIIKHYCILNKMVWRYTLISI